jgi:hypothetical protein
MKKTLILTALVAFAVADVALAADTTDHMTDHNMMAPAAGSRNAKGEYEMGRPMKTVEGKQPAAPGSRKKRKSTKQKNGNTGNTVVKKQLSKLIVDIDENKMTLAQVQQTLRDIVAGMN